ncbi:MAG TPA: sulfatase-like hydrolase/transferase, partial [Polyangia bacterium]
MSEESNNRAAPPRRSAWDWPAAGLMAGAVVGGLDTLWAVARGVGGLAPGKGAVLVSLGLTWGGLAGLLIGLAVAAAAAVIARVASSGSSRRLAWLPEAAVALVAAPLVAHVAYAAFTGHRAATLPGRSLLSAGLSLGGVAAVFLLGRLFRRFAARLSVERPAPSARWLVVGALVGTCLASEIANQLVLPRLYPWFHSALAVVTGLAALLTARLLLITRGRPIRARWTAMAIGATAAVAVFAGVKAHASQIVRFAALERTAATAQLLRLSPVSLRSRTYVADHRHELESSLPPLPEGPRRPEADVLLITVDALRADHVGAFGYRRRPTTPHIDELAARSVRFTRAYAQAPHTSFSVASMLTGKYFPTLARLAPAEVHDPITSPLRRYGWRTAAFYPPAVFYVDAQKLKAYADTNFAFEYIKFEYLEAEKRVDQVVRYYETEKPKRSFVWVHFFEPHEPYVAHPEFPFGGGDIDRYDSEIAYADSAIGRLLAYLRVHRPSTIVVLAADHGEEFDEHGGRYHGSSLFEEQIHVPLLISVPGVSARDVDQPVELIDIAPTVLNLLDIPVPARMRGTDLGPWLATPPAQATRLPPAFAELEDKRMVVRGQEKLICDLNWGFCAYYDLAKDPGERHNRADEAPERVADLRGVLDEWLDGHVRYEPVLAKGEANPNGERVPKAIERGRLGDLMAAPALAELMLSVDAPLPVRREAAELLVALPPRKQTTPQLALAASDKDEVIADWAAVGAVRGGDPAATQRVRAVVSDPARPRKLRVRGALALAARDDHTGVPTLAEALGDCQDDVLLCRLIILQIGKLKDRRAVPALIAHLPEVQNRREMVDALGDIGDPAAVAPLLDRLQHDEYVPVRAQAARALAKIGRTDVVPILDKVAHEDTEASVAAAAREA